MREIERREIGREEGSKGARKGEREEDLRIEDWAFDVKAQSH